MLEYIDGLLRTDHRPMTYHPDLIMCGSTGNRVYGSFRKSPGLCGIFHFVHKSDLTDLIELDFKEMVCPLKLRTTYEWMPSHLYMKHVYPCFIIEERKYITAGDLIVSRICIKSVSGRIKFKLGLKSRVLDDNYRKKLELFNQSVDIKAFCSENELFGHKQIVLEQDGEFRFTVACGFKVKGEGWPEGITDLEGHKEEYGRFYRGIPKLTCSDREVEKVYYYRWFLLRHHMADPKLGNIKHPLLYEGRHGYFKEEGDGEAVEWEFSKGILASVHHHLLEMRWHKGGEAAKEEILNYTGNFGKMETFLEYEYDVPLLPGCIRIHDFVGHYFFHLLPYAAWQIYQATEDREWLRSITPVLWEDLCGWSRYDPENSGLPVMIYEGDSAMEFGPASHYHPGDKAWDAKQAGEGPAVGLACDYMAEGGVWGGPVPNRRTEVAAFYGLNYYAFHRIYNLLGDKDRAEYCLDRCNAVKSAVMKHLWDEQEGFFLEMAEGFEPIRQVKQVGGIFCLLLVDPKNPRSFLDNLTDGEKFNQKHGIASASKDSFGYFPNNTVNGTRAHTCMWNGPTWPYSTSLALLALGNFIKRMEKSGLRDQYARHFKEEFSKYTRQHFLFGNEKDLRIVEHYNPETGAPLSGQDDYNHSSYIDLLIRHVCGLDTDDAGNIKFSPVDVGIEYLKLEGIHFGNSCYDVEIRGGSATLYKDGRKAGSGQKTLLMH